MKKLLASTLFLLFIVVIIVPALIVYTIHLFPSIIVKTGDQVIRVYFPATGQVRAIPLEEYLAGVVAAEMPANFEPEALKAQTIAARTYALKKKELSGQTPNNSHPQADVCTDPNHCQAWTNLDSMRQQWGPIRYWFFRQKIETAISATKGMVLTYQGQLIDPVFHSTCGGYTENAADVWHFDLPYLKSVPCAGDRSAPRYRSTASFTLAELGSRLGVNLEALPATSGTGTEWLRVTDYSDSGRIKTLAIGAQTMSGADFRRLLGLNSTNFNWLLEQDRIVFTVTGYGHGVGMCQYGANSMAKQGKTCREILSHYYTGIVVENYGSQP